MLSGLAVAATKRDKAANPEGLANSKSRANVNSSADGCQITPAACTPVYGTSA